MALTPAEFETVKDYATKIIALESEVTALSRWFITVRQRANPSDPLNSGATLSALATQFATEYARRKTVINTLVNQLA